jgi:hypothetical protein
MPVKAAFSRKRIHFDIPQTLPVGQLRECHNPKMLGAPQGLDLVITLITIEQILKSPPGKLLHQLRKDRCSGIH